MDDEWTIFKANNAIRIWLDDCDKPHQALEFLIEKAESFDQVFADYQDLGRLWNESMCEVEKLEQESSEKVGSLSKIRTTVISNDNFYIAQAYLNGVKDAIKAFNKNNGNLEEI